MVSKPKNSVLEYSKDGRFASIFCEEPDREIQIFYRSNEMVDPQLYYAKHDNFESEVASTISFVPTFDHTGELRNRF